jgi:hypothetical protein
LPVRYLLQNGVGHAAHQIGRNLQAINLLKMSADVTGGKASGVEPNDLVIHAINPGLTLLDQLRLKTAIHCPAVETPFR